ncbi:MAG: hypothetical protein AAFO91_00635 [Bacteroidota bacterium]
MALQNSTISTSEDWLRFFQDQLHLTAEVAQGYANEFESQNITGDNIVMGLNEPGFLSQLNMSLGYQLELKARFCPATDMSLSRPPSNKVPAPTVRMDISQMELSNFPSNGSVIKAIIILDTMPQPVSFSAAQKKYVSTCALPNHLMFGNGLKL